jgi:hypothetical protein
MREKKSTGRILTNPIPPKAMGWGVRERTCQKRAQSCIFAPAVEMIIATQR